jgi:1-pyrroline-5-carboxylate dehydrogenase
MIHGNVRPPTPVNEPNLSYAPGTPERDGLKAALSRMSGEQVEIPLVIGGKRVHTGTLTDIRMPHRHAHLLGRAHVAGAPQIEQAIAAARAAKPDWAATPFHERAAIFLRAAELLATKYRPLINAATMLGQSKTAHQAEIDAASESIDFLRFNVQFAHELLSQQPLSSPGVWNFTDYRPLDGFVLAIAPFNFTSIAVNLPTAPALMGNTVLFKPAQTALTSAWQLMEVLREAGLPDGVVNFIPSPGRVLGQTIFQSPELAGVHFTGSTGVFNGMWKAVGENIGRYKQYPRLVGETGGKDFVFAHASAIDDLDALATAIVRGGFEYQGQKCSACSRVYVPASIWKQLEPRLRELIAGLQMGDVADFRNFLGAVIDEASFENTSAYIQLAKQGGGARIVAGGEVDKREGWFVRPTLVECTDPRHRIMVEEIFAPVVGLHVYPDDRYVETLRECDQAAAYALTGAVWARDRKAIAVAMHELRSSAGNFYVNDKPTGAVVGQQPFGGSRGSGTNDKAGSALNLVRWTSARTVKENFAPPTKVGYPFMGAE